MDRNPELKIKKNELLLLPSCTASLFNEILAGLPASGNPKGLGPGIAENEAGAS